MLKSVAASSIIACLLGIFASFLGNKYIVFRSISGNFSEQLFHFFLLYAFVAIFHGLFIFAWADLKGYNYRIGFVIATGLQFLITYNYNKGVIFKK